VESIGLTSLIHDEDITIRENETMGQSWYCFVFETHGSACADAERDNDWIWSEFWFIICMSSHAIMTITIPIAQNRIDSNSIMMSKIGFEIAKERWSS
jgi:hypothetical protein